jgi:sortase A
LAGLGEVLMILGVILMPFVGHQLWWTNVAAARAAEQAASQVQQSWAATVPPAAQEWPRPATPAADQPEVGATFGLIA